MNNENPKAIENGLTWSSFLADIPAVELPAAVRAALADYTDGSQPFGVPQIRAAWNNQFEDAPRPSQEPESITIIRRMTNCLHDLQKTEIQPNGILAAVIECRICGYARPVFNDTPENSKALALLRKAKAI